MDLHFIINILLVGFAIFSWIGYKSDRSQNKQNLDEFIDNQIPIRELTANEVLLLEPYLNNKWSVYPYKHQTSLLNEDVLELTGICTRHSLYTNAQETSYYYEINGIEVFFPYNMDRYISENNVAEIVFTNSYAFIVKINDYDLQKAADNVDDEKQSEEYWQTGQSMPFTNIEHNQTDYITHSSIERERSTKLDYVIIEQREETPLESAVRNKQNKGWLTALFLVLAVIFFVKYWHSENIKILILIIISLFLAFFCYWLKPKSKIYNINRIRGKIDANKSLDRKIVIGDTLFIKYPMHWIFFLPQNTTSDVEMDVSVNDNKLVRYGHTLSISREIEQFGPPKFLKRNFLLFITGLILSGVLIYVSDIVDNALFSYRIINNTVTIRNIDNIDALKNTSLDKGDLVNIKINGASCDVTNSENYDKCQKIIINTQPTTDPNYNLKQIPNWIMNLYSDNLINTTRDSSVKYAEAKLKSGIELLNQMYKNNNYYAPYSENIELTKLLNVGHLISVVNESCELSDQLDCSEIKNALLDCIAPQKSYFENWSDMVKFGNKHQNYEEIITDEDLRDLHYGIKKIRIILLEQQTELLKRAVANYQKNESSFSLTLANNQYAEITIPNNPDFKNTGILPLIYYYNTLFGQGGNINITGLVTGFDYHDDNSIANLTINADPHYGMDKNELISFTSPLIINIVIFGVIVLITFGNGLMFCWKLIVNNRRQNKIISNYSNFML